MSKFNIATTFDLFDLSLNFQFIDIFYLFSIGIPELYFWLYKWWNCYFKPKLFMFYLSTFHRHYAIILTMDPNIFEPAKEKIRKLKEKKHKEEIANSKQYKQYVYVIFIFVCLVTFSTIFCNSSLTDLNDFGILYDILNCNDEVSDYLDDTAENPEYLENKQKFTLNKNEDEEFYSDND